MSIFLPVFVLYIKLPTSSNCSPAASSSKAGIPARYGRQVAQQITGIVKQTMKKQGLSLDTLPEMWLRNKLEFPKTLLIERRVATDRLIRRYELV
jgi:hypothetical protein